MDTKTHSELTFEHQGSSDVTDAQGASTTLSTHVCKLKLPTALMVELLHLVLAHFGQHNCCDHQPDLELP